LAKREDEDSSEGEEENQKIFTGAADVNLEQFYRRTRLAILRKLLIWRGL